MEIHLARDGASLGIFTLDQVREGLAAGRFRLSDLAWRAGMDSWRTLADWPEFAALPFAVAPGGPPVVSEVPWEIRPSLGSLLQTAWLTVSRPSVFASARFESGRAFGGAYLALLVIFLPLLGLVLIQQHNEKAQLEALTQLVRSFSPEAAEAMAQRGGESRVDLADAGLVATSCALLCILPIMPLLAALWGICTWPFLRLLGAKVAFPRLILATLLLSTLCYLVFAPLFYVPRLISILDPLAGLGLEFVCLLGWFLLTVRAVGQAAGAGFWRVLGANVLIVTVLCLCCCCLSFVVGMAAGAGR